MLDWRWLVGSGDKAQRLPFLAPSAQGSEKDDSELLFVELSHFSGLLSKKPGASCTLSRASLSLKERFFYFYAYERSCMNGRRSALLAGT